MRRRHVSKDSDLVKLNARVPRPLALALHHEAIDRGTSIEALVIRALGTELKRPEIANRALLAR